MRTAITGLTADGGGDSPEAYAGALEHVDLDAEVGWRPRARRLTIIVGDEMPHDDDLNSGIPAESQAFASPFSTGVDAGRDAITGTADDLDWQPLLKRTANNGLTILYVLFQGPAEYLPYCRRAVDCPPARVPLPPVAGNAMMALVRHRLRPLLALGVAGYLLGLAMSAVACSDADPTLACSDSGEMDPVLWFAGLVGISGVLAHRLPTWQRALLIVLGTVVLPANLAAPGFLFR